jgi:hypothetical protein
VHSFRTLLADLATLAKNRVRFSGGNATTIAGGNATTTAGSNAATTAGGDATTTAGSDAATTEMLTTPTPHQQHVFDLLKVSPAM